MAAKPTHRSINTTKLLLCMMGVIVILQCYQVKCCVQNERTTLLQIKSYFPSWPLPDVKDDCCLWERVRCSSVAGRITHLFLGNTVPRTEPWSLNMTLFQQFQELRVLDLSENHIGSLSESQDICRLRSLEEINLYSNQLSNGLPDCLWNMTSLRVLELSNNYLTGSLPSFITLPSLEFLSITDNNFQGRFSISSITNHSRLLEVLMLSSNGLQVEIEEPFYTTTLQALGLGSCTINTQTKAFLNFISSQTKLHYIDLSSNGITGAFPAWLLQSNSNLKLLDLGNNSLTGSLHIPQLRNLPLGFLDVSNNRFTGKIPLHIGVTLPALKVLGMSRNSFRGHVPPSIGNLTQLVALDLSHNKLSGRLPKQFLSSCSHLQFLFLSNNTLQGEIIPSYMNLPSLISLNLDHNQFFGTMEESLKISTKLKYLDISNNSVTGEFPSWIGSLDKLQMMSLARNHIQGSIPTQLCNLQQLTFLDLSENRFTGIIPSCGGFSSLKHLHMHGNSLSGSIPQGLVGSSRLVTLDLANNQLSGAIPYWIHQLSDMVILLLGDNHLQGEVPIELCQLRHVNILDLSNNSLVGAIPSCFRDLSLGKRRTNDLYIGFHGEVEDAIDTLFKLKAHLYLPINEFETVTRPEEVDFTVKNRLASYKGTSLYFMSVLDLSCNQLIDVIPAELGELTSLAAMNLSRNHLSGPIPESFSNLKSIESLDLSYNKLIGRIPLQLVDLNFLAIFDVSYNNLSGRVPETGQFGSFDERVYKGNPNLCGSLLPKSCTLVEPQYGHSSECGHDGKCKFDLQVFFLSFGISFIIALLTFMFVFYIKIGLA